MRTSPSSTRLRARRGRCARSGWKQHLDFGSQLMKDALMRGQIAGVGVG